MIQMIDFRGRFVKVKQRNFNVIVATSQGQSCMCTILLNIASSDGILVSANLKKNLPIMLIVVGSKG